MQRKRRVTAASVSGAARDISEGKGRCDLLPLDTIASLFSIPSDKEILKLIDSFLKTGDTNYLRNAILEFNDQRKCNFITMILELSIHYEDGANKYEPNNWKQGMPVHCFIDSGIRHYLKWLRGDQDEPHDRAFVWNMVGAIWTMENKPELNDISGY